MINDIKIKNNNSLVKRNGGVINTDKAEYEEAKERAKRQQQIDKSLNNLVDLEKRMDDIEDKLNNILNILKNR